MSAVPSWQDCHAAGMSLTEAARARGRTVGAAQSWALARGVKFVDGRTKPAFREINGERMKKLNAERHMWSRCHISSMTKEQRRDYSTFRRAGYEIDEALTILGLKTPEEARA